MPRSTIVKKLANAVGWVDRWTAAAGRNCCVTRSHAALDEALRAERCGPLAEESPEATRDRHAAAARAFGERT